VLVTGGSSGLGKEVAKCLLSKGASVTIAARRKNVLDEAKSELLEFTSKEASLEVVTADVTDQESARNMVAEAERLQDHVVDCVFCCAGAATPGFFIEQSPEIFAKQMQLNYLGVINSIHPAVKRMIEAGKGGKVVLVSSTLGLMGMIGYSQYSSAKFALRGLAESLRQELLPYSISVHIFFVATIDSPGNEVENEHKPAITKMIEEGDISDPSPIKRAQTLLKGVESGDFAISSDIATELIRAASRGNAPGNGMFVDALLCTLGFVFLPMWRRYADYLVMKHKNVRNC
jgi:3-dehydrosphinganine reductase